MRELPDISRFVWEAKYRRGGESTPEDSFMRVARAVAGNEAQPELWAERFYGLLRSRRFLPGGRVLAGAGTGRRVTLFNCFVGRSPDDSLGGILDTLKETALTLQQGGGVGCDFSRLRPAGSPTTASGAIASGPVSFMHLWDTLSATLLSTGSRRGAMMATLRCDHPDIESFITAKLDGTSLQQFNLSVLVSDAFMEAVAADASWRLCFSALESPAGVDAGRGRTVSARWLWGRLCEAAHASAEPGVLFEDRINRENNLGYRERISATNPCGEVPLPTYGACDLGSINLREFVEVPFTAEAQLDRQALLETVSLAVRFLDNVIDVSRFPLPQQAEQARGARRIGLGLTGLADALAMLGLHYGSEAARAKAAMIMRWIRDAAYAASMDLAAQRGPFPFLDRDAYLEAPFIRSLPAAYRRRIADTGIRNSHLLSIAPAGSISLLADNVSSGIEPIYMLEGQRLVRDRDGRAKTIEVRDPAWTEWLQAGGDPAQRPGVFVTAAELPGRAHLAMQASLQRWVDNAISKTVTLPADAAVDEVSSIYREAWSLGLKGCTVYRAGSLAGAVLREQHDTRCCPVDFL